MTASYGHSVGTMRSEESKEKGLEGSNADNKTVAPRLFSLKRAAEYLGISYWTIRDYIFRGELPSVRLGRRVLVDVRDLDALVEKYKEVWF